MLDSESTAYPDAAPARGRYPVVLFATGGGGTPLTHAPTCELPASHGFYVFTGPSEGRDGLPVYLDAITLDQKVRDMIGAVVKGTLDDAYRVAYDFVCEALVEVAKHTLNSAEPWSLTRFR